MFSSCNFVHVCDDKNVPQSFSARADPAVGAIDAPPDYLVSWGGGYPSTPAASRSQHLRHFVIQPPPDSYNVNVIVVLNANVLRLDEDRRQRRSGISFWT